MGKHSWWHIDEGTGLLWTVQLIIAFQARPRPCTLYEISAGSHPERTACSFC